MPQFFEKEPVMIVKTEAELRNRPFGEQLFFIFLVKCSKSMIELHSLTNFDGYAWEMVQGQANYHSFS